jgi:hypothetical protein
MSIITLLLMLVIGAVIIYGVKLALAGAWQQLLITVVVLIVALWILGALGISLPSLPSA